MRLRLLLPALVVPGLLALPVVALPAAAARPVAPVVVEVPLSAPAVTGSALRGAGARTVAAAPPRTTAPFEVVGVTWDAGDVGDLAVRVRTRSAGTWSPWTPLTVESDGPTGAEAEGARPGTDPLWVGEADGVQAQVDLLSGAAPRGVRLALVDPGESPADAASTPASTASAAGTVPDVRPRSAWGADESIRGAKPSYAASLQAVTLHHTASSSDYAREDVPGLLRGFYAYHVKSNGWSDIGYNFLVDRFGTVWEGRWGGTTRNVVGAHAGGFNTGTVGISMIGTYETTPPSAAMLESVAQVAGWRLGSNGLDPADSVTLTSAGSTRWASGTPVRLGRVFAHREVSTTSCPGTQGMAALPGLRARASALAAGALPLVPQPDDALRVDLPATAEPGSTVEAVVHGPAGRPVQLWFADPGAEGATLRREGVLDADGLYRTGFPADGTHTLFAAVDGRTSPRATTTVGSGGSPVGLTPSALSVSGPVTVEAGAEALVTVTGPAGTAVGLWFREEGSQQFVQRRRGQLGPDGTWTTTYTAGRPQDYFAMSSTVTSADATTLVGPVPHGLHVTAPAAVVGGSTVPLVVQGTPGAAVELWFSRAGAPFSRRREGVLAADGTYRTTWSATDEHTVFAASGGRTSTRVTTRVPGSVPYAPATDDQAPRLQVEVPRTVDAGASAEVVVRGTPGAPVALWFQPRGEEVFVQRRSAVLAADGAYRTTFAGSEDQLLYATSGGSASPDVASDVRPVLTAPATGRIGVPVVLTGRARPGDAVVVEQRTRAGAVVRRTATADRGGSYRLSVPLRDASTWRPSVGDRVGSTWATTTVTPTLVAPARSGRGSTVRITGTARPGATVEVLFRAKGAPVFAVRRRLTADAAGHWATTAALAVAHRLYARADGLASPQRIVDVR